MKKILAIILAMLMVLSVFSVNVFADETEVDSPDVEKVPVDIIVFESEEPVSENLAPWANFGWGGWDLDYRKEGAELTDITIEDVRAIAAEGGAIYTVTYKAGGTWEKGLPVLALNGDFTNDEDSVRVIAASSVTVNNGMYTVTFNLDDVVAAAAEREQTINQLAIQSWRWDTYLYSAKLTVMREPVAISVNDVAFDGTLQEAVTSAEDGATIKVGKNLTGTGVVVPEGKNITIDFGGNTYTVNSATVGSAGTETNGFQILNGAKVTLTNGTLTDKTAKILIQNYADLTLDNMNVVSANADYVVSNNNGKLNVIGNTSIKAAEGKTAFDMYYWPNKGYDAINVTVNTTGTIEGNIKISADGSADFNTVASKLALDLKAGTFKGNFVVDADALKYEYKTETPVVPEYAPFEKATTLGLYDNDGAIGTVIIDKPNSEYTVSGKIANNGYLLLKATSANNGTDEVSNLPKDAKIDITKIVSAGGEFTDVSSVTITDDHKVLIWFKAPWGGGDCVDSVVNGDITITLKVTDPNATLLQPTPDTPIGPTEAEKKAALYKALGEKVVKLADGTKFTDADVKLFGVKTFEVNGFTCVGNKPVSTKNSGVSAFIYVNEEYHGMMLNGHLICQPHDADNIFDYCPVCHAIIEKDEEVEVEVVDPTEPGDVNTEDDEPSINVTEPEPEKPAEDKNPPMGLALAVLPMALAAAALAASKRR